MWPNGAKQRAAGALWCLVQVRTHRLLTPRARTHAPTHITPPCPPSSRKRFSLWMPKQEDFEGDRDHEDDDDPLAPPPPPKLVPVEEILILLVLKNVRARLVSRHRRSEGCGRSSIGGQRMAI